MVHDRRFAALAMTKEEVAIHRKVASKEFIQEENGSIEKEEHLEKAKKKEKTINIFEADDMDAVSKMIYNLK
jgi:hypothetical protein